MTLLTFVRDGETGMPLFALMADDGEGHLVPNPHFPLAPDDEVLAARVSRLTQPPATERDWLSVLSQFASFDNSIDPVAEVNSLKDAQRIAKGTFAEITGADDDTWFVGLDDANANTTRAWDTLVRDSPSTADALGSDDPDAEIDDQAMLNYVIMTMGPIDPDGPNGWLLAVADGEPMPEGAYLHFGDPGDENEESDGVTTAGD